MDSLREDDDLKVLVLVHYGSDWKHHTLLRKIPYFTLAGYVIQPD